MTLNRVQQYSPNRVHKYSPNRVQQYSPNRVHQYLSNRVQQYSPNRVQQYSPNRVHKYSPNRVHKYSPKRVQQYSPACTCWGVVVSVCLQILMLSGHTALFLYLKFAGVVYIIGVKYSWSRVCIPSRISSAAGSTVYWHKMVSKLRYLCWPRWSFRTIHDAIWFTTRWRSSVYAKFNFYLIENGLYLHYKHQTVNLYKEITAVYCVSHMKAVSTGDVIILQGWSMSARIYIYFLLCLLPFSVSI